MAGLAQHEFGGSVNSGWYFYPNYGLDYFAQLQVVAVDYPNLFPTASRDTALWATPWRLLPASDGYIVGDA